MGTYSPKVAEVERDWHLLDANGMVLGRIATEAATLLRGKHKPTYAPHIDTGDHVVVINAAKLDVSQRKSEDKQFYRHSGYPGGLRSRSLSNRMTHQPEEVVRDAIAGMLPKGRLGRAMVKKLHVYSNGTHPHAAQSPKPRVLQHGTRREET